MAALPAGRPLERQPCLERKNDQEWDKMTPEEREKFQAEWKNRCGGRWQMRERETENVAE